jgi:hypothetical protein
MGHIPDMTDPNDDLSSIADPGAIGPEQMTQPDNDPDLDRADATRPDGYEGGADVESQAIQGAPLGPPD